MRSLIVFVFAFLLYAGTFDHGYVLDDNDVIALNDITHKGFGGLPEIFSKTYRANSSFSGDDLYRPLSRALYAIEWEFWPRSPRASHVMNVLLYALTCLLLHRVLLRFLKEPVVPFIAALIFAAHPIHSEAVSNIKSGEEILALLFSLLSLLFVHKYSQNNKFLNLFFSILFLFVALLAKESAVVFVAVIPISLYFFTGISGKKNVLASTLFILPLLVYLFVRYAVVGSFSTQLAENTNFIAGIDNFFEQKATAICILGYYLLILFVPFRLMSDGSFNEFPAATPGDWRFLLAFVVLSVLFVFAILKFKSRRIESYAILFFLVSVTVASNIFVQIGTSYGERLMFTPSVGICLLFAVLITKLFKSGKKLEKPDFKKPILASLLLVIPYSVKTVVRAADWKDELTLYTKDAVSAPNSARAQYYLGNQYAVDLPTVLDPSTRESYTSIGIASLSRAIAIKPDYDEAYYSLGEIYSYNGKLDSAASNYLKAANISPNVARFQNNYGDIMFKLGNYQVAREHFELAVQYDSLYRDAWTNLGTSYARYGQHWLEDAQKAQRENNIDSLNKYYAISMAYYDTSITLLNRAIDIDQYFYLPYQILGIVYQNKSDTAKAAYYYGKANELR